MTTHNYSFPKSKKLKSRKAIAHLFQSGRASFLYPVKLLLDYPETATEKGFRATVAVSKRNVGSAVQRNSIKRKMREAIRLHQQLIAADRYTELLFIYVGKTDVDPQQLTRAIRLLMERQFTQ
jgi:ribonuclease P protein component